MRTRASDCRLRRPPIVASSSSGMGSSPSSRINIRSPGFRPLSASRRYRLGSGLRADRTGGRGRLGVMFAAAAIPGSARPAASTRVSRRLSRSADLRGLSGISPRLVRRAVASLLNCSTIWGVASPASRARMLRSTTCSYVLSGSAGSIAGRGSSGRMASVRIGATSCWYFRSRSAVMAPSCSLRTCPDFARAVLLA